MLVNPQKPFMPVRILFAQVDYTARSPEARDWAVLSYSHVLHICFSVIDMGGNVRYFRTATRTNEENPLSIGDLLPSYRHFIEGEVLFAPLTILAGYYDPHRISLQFMSVCRVFPVYRESGTRSYPAADHGLHDFFTRQLRSAVDILAKFRQAELHTSLLLIQEDASDGKAAGCLFLLKLL